MAVRKLEVQIVGDDRSLNRALGRSEKKLSNFGQVARRATAGIATIGAGAAGAAGKMIDLASDAEETASKFKIVFGREARSARLELDRFSKAAGTSRFALRDQAAGFQALIRPMGVASGQAGKMSVGLTKLATDLASFNNTSVEDAMVALKSGLVGEAEPLRRYGVQLSAARVQAYAYAKGIAKTGTDLNAAQKAQASYALILRDTKLAQGDAVRTSGSFANQLKRLKGTITDNATELGAKLLPAATAAVGGMTRFIGQMREGTGFGGQLRQAVTNVATVVSSFAANVGPATFGLAKLGVSLLTTRTGMTLLGAAIGALTGRMAGLATAFVVTRVAAFAAAIGGLRNIALIAGTALIQLRTGLIGVSAASATTGIGALLTVVGLAVGALIGFRSQTTQATVSQQQFRDAILGVRDALDRYKDAGSAVKDANLQQRSAEVGLAEALQRRRQLQASGTASALELKRADVDVATAKREVERTTKAATRAERDEGATRRKAIGEAREQINVLRGRARTVENSLPIHRKFNLTQIAAGAGGERLRNVTLRLKEEQLRLARATGASGGKINKLRSEISLLKSKEVKVTLAMAVKGLKDQANPFGGRGGSGLSVNRAVDQKAQEWTDSNKPKFANLLQRLSGGVGTAKGDLGKYEALGHKYGLQTTSGLRRGDPGWHGKNRARDLSDGVNTPGMMKYARHMFSKFGKNLLELIYTPMGVGIKDGKPVNIRSFYGAKVAAAHHNHVHVAAQRGGMVPGSGVGDKVPALLEPKEGIINSRAVKALGGPPAINAINAAVPRFQEGGNVFRTWAGMVKRAGKRGKWSKRKMATIYEAMLRANAVETGALGNNPLGGDGGRSAGWFQMTNEKGSVAQRRDPHFAGSWFLKTADQMYRKGVSSPLLAANVERPREDLRFKYGSGKYVPTGRVQKMVQAFQSSRRRGGPGPAAAPRAPRRKPVKPTKGRYRFSYEDQIALADLGLAEAEETGPGTVGTHKGRRGQTVLDKDYRDDDRRAIAKKQRLLAERNRKVLARLGKINRALKGKLKPADRKRLLAERTQLLQERGTLHSERTGLDTKLKELYAPPETQTEPTGDPAADEPKSDPAAEAAAAAQQADAEARKELAAAVLALKGSIDEQNAHASSVAGITVREISTALGNMITGELGARVGQRLQTAGDGFSMARY